MGPHHYIPSSRLSLSETSQAHNCCRTTACPGPDGPVSQTRHEVDRVSETRKDDPEGSHDSTNAHTLCTELGCCTSMLQVFDQIDDDRIGELGS